MTEGLKAWWYGGPNWGDMLTPYIIRHLAGVEVILSRGPGTTLVAGSIMQDLRDDDVVWGTGIISPLHVPKPFPKNVRFHAVRGPHTRDLLLKEGQEVPEVYGDPALLLPYFYKVEAQPKWKVGIIPHIVDTPHVLPPADPDVHLIDIGAGFAQVLQEALCCEKIISSSLHGLILGDAWSKPTAWLQVDEAGRIVGKDFKFLDHLAATGRNLFPVNCIKSKEPLALDTIKWLTPPQIDLQQLLKACPFSRYSTLTEIPMLSL